MKVVKGKSIKPSESDISQEVITEDKLNEEIAETNKLKKAYEKEERNRKLFGKQPSNFYAGDKAHEELGSNISDREKRGYGGRG